MVLVTGARALPQASVAVHVSVIVPPQGPGAAEKVEVLDVPVIRHEPASPFVKLRVDAVGVAPHAIVIAAGAVIVGNGAGVTLIVLVPLMVLLHASVKVQVTVIVLETGVSALPHASVAVHVSVIVPPQGPGVAEKVDVFEVPLIRQDPV